MTDDVAARASDVLGVTVDELRAALDRTRNLDRLLRVGHPTTTARHYALQHHLDDPVASAPATDRWARHRVAALAIAGLTWYRSAVEDRNADTEAAFAAMVAGQGAAVETVECDGDTCSAVISGQAYTVLVQEDEDGQQHFGVAAYTGD